MSSEVKLTSAEMGSLWADYINYTVAKQSFVYFLNNVEDSSIHEILKQALQATNSDLDFLTDVFTKASIPLPVGFTDDDVNPGAPRLFSDSYYLSFLRNMSLISMNLAVLSLHMATRADIINYYQDKISTAGEYNTMIKNLELDKGIYVRPPSVPTPNKVEFVKKQSYLGNMFGRQRPLNTAEVTQLHHNIQTNVKGKTLILGFAQVTTSEELREYFLRGKKISEKHVDIFSDLLEVDDIPAAKPWDTGVTDSKVAPFSDKLMLFMISGAATTSIGNYGAAIATSPRKDLGMMYARLLGEVTLYAEDGANVMIKNGWLEEPPQVPDRHQLTR